MAKVLVSDPIADKGIEILEEAGGVSKSDILALVSKKKSVEVMETSFLE